MSEIIKAKNGKLHIYVRQDTYKGKLRSENWVGRTFFQGKQRVLSSGTKDLEKAKEVLEKWYDRLQNSQEIHQENLDSSVFESKKGEDQISSTNEPETNHKGDTKQVKPNTPTLKQSSKSSILEKLKNTKLFL